MTTVPDPPVPMAKPLKIVLAVLGALLLLLLAAIVALPLLFDPNDYRRQIGEAVQRETGRSFTVGEIRLSVFPWLRVELRDATLGNAEGFGPDPMLTVQRAELGVKLMPLLREKRVEASTVQLDGATVRLGVDAEGRDNWSDLAKRQEQPSASNEPEKQGGLKDLDIEGLSLKDVVVHYDDRRATKRYRVELPSLSTGRLHGNEPVKVEGQLKATSETPAAQAQIEFATEVVRDAASGEVQLRQPKFSLAGSLSGPNPMSTNLKAETELLRWSAATQKLDAAPLSLEITEFVRGAAEAPQLRAKGSIKGALASDLGQKKHALRDFDVALNLEGSMLPGGKPQTLRLTGALEADLAAQQILLLAPQLATFGLKASGESWLVSGLDGDAPTVAGDLKLAPFEPRALLAALGIAVPQTADAKVLQAASVQTRFSANARQAKLSQLSAQLDDTRLQGEVNIRDFASKAIAFGLKADRLDADRYLPPAAKPAVGDAPAAAKADFDATPLPFDALRKLNAEGTLEIASLKLKNVQFSDASLKLDGSGGSKRQKLQARLYGGRADLALRLTPGQPESLRLALSGIEALPLLKDFMDSDKLSGKGSMTLDVTVRGDTVGAAKRSLNGTLAFNLVDGAVKGFNLGKLLRDGQAMLALQSGAGGGTAPSTDFAELRGGGTFVNGVLKSDQLTAKNPLIRLEGAGELNLVSETIDYLAKPTLVNTASGQGGKERADLSGIIVPIRITGSFAKPRIAIDWQAALKQQAATELREKLGVSEDTVREKREELRGKVKEELNKALGEDLSKGLQGLFGKKPAPAPPPPEPQPEPAPETKPQ